MALLIPATLVVLAQAIFIVTLAYAPARSTSRPIAVAIVASLVACLQFVLPHHLDNKLHAAFIQPFMWIHVLNAHDMLCLSRICFPVGAGAAKKQDGDSSARADAGADADAGERLSWACGAAWELHAARFPWRIKAPRPFSTTDPTYVPSRPHFLVRRLIETLVCLALMDLSASQPQPDVDPFFAPGMDAFFSRLPDVTWEEVLVRSITTLAFWVNLVCLINLIYGGMALVAVACKIHQPAEWPPLLGSPSAMWSVRQLWGYAVASLLRSIGDQGGSIADQPPLAATAGINSCGGR